MQVPSFIESVDEPTVLGRTIRDTTGRKYYQTPASQGSAVRVASNVPGDNMVGEMNEGEMIGFRKEGKFYVPLQVRRGVAEPRRIFAMLSRMRVDRIFFNENADYADNVDPDLLDRLCRPYEEYDQFRTELRRRLKKESVFNVPAWLRRQPTIEILEALAAIKSRKERIATVAAMMMANHDFIETLECDAPETLEWLGSAAGDFMDAADDAEVEDPEVEDPEVGGCVADTLETTSREMVGEKFTDNVDLNGDDGDADLIESRMRAIERQLQELTGLLAKSVHPTPEPQTVESYGAPEDIFEVAAAPVDVESYKGVRDPIVKEHVLALGGAELKLDAAAVLEKSGERVTISLPRDVDDSFFQTSDGADIAAGDGFFDGDAVKEASAALSVDGAPNVIRILKLGE